MWKTISRQDERTPTPGSRGLTPAIAVMAVMCALVLSEARTLAGGQEQLQRKPLVNQRLPVVTAITPTGPNGVPVIRAGQMFSILGRDFPTNVTAVSVVISAAPVVKTGPLVSRPQTLATLHPSAASVTRLDVLAPASLPAGAGQYLVQVVTGTGALSNSIAVQYEVAIAGHVHVANTRGVAGIMEQEVAIGGYLRDANNHGFAGIMMTATDPTKPAPYKAWTDADGHYVLHVPAPFTGQVLVHRPNNCFDCTNITRNLVNQFFDLLDVNFTCSNTTLIVGRTKTQYNDMISGVVLNGLPGNPVTDAYGDYQATVDCGWSGTVTPVKAGWVFSPPSWTYSSLTQMPPRQDYIGGVLRYEISGLVQTSSADGIAGVKLNGLYPTSAGESSVTDASGLLSRDR